MALDSLDYIPELCRQFATGNCYLGPFCKYRHRVFLERLSDYAQICELNNCTRPECTNLHITKQEENLFRNEEVIPSKLVCRYTIMLSFLITEFGLEYVEAQTSLFEILSTVPPPERGQLLQHVMECLLQCSPLAQPPSPHCSPTTNTGYQQPAMTPVGAIQPQYPFPPPSLSGDMDTAYTYMDYVTQVPPYTPSSTCLGPMECKRCNEEIKPQIPARTVEQTSHVRTYTNEARALLLAPPPSSSSLLLTSSTRTSYFEPGDNKRRKIVQESPIADAPRSSAVSVSREPPTAPPPQSLTTNTPFSNKTSKGSDLVATDVPMKTQRKPPAISSRRPSIATGPREPPTAPSPQSLTVNTMATKKVSKCFDLVTTELKTNQKPTTISPRRSSAITVPRELPIGPSSPQSLTTNTMISKKTSKGSDLVITEGKTNQYPPTINSQRASVMNIPRESPASASPPSSPQQLSTNTMIFNKMTSFSSGPSSVAEIKTEPKSPTTLLPPLLAPQSLTVTTNSSNSSCIDTEINADPRLSPYVILEELRGALQLPSPPPPPPLPAPQSLTVTTNSTGSSFIEVKTEPKSTTDSPRSPSMSIPRASPLVFPQVAPPPPPPPSPPPTTLSQSLMTTFNSPDLSLIEVKTEPKSTTDSPRSPASYEVRASPQVAPLPSLNTMSSEAMTSYKLDPNIVAINVKTESEPPTVSPMSPVMNVFRTHVPHTELSHHLLATKRKREDELMSSTMDAQTSPEFVASKRLKLETPLEESLTAVRANEINISQNLDNTSLKVETSTSPEIVAPIPMETSMDAASLASTYQSPTTQGVSPLTFCPAPVFAYSPWHQIPWETIKQILSQKPPPPPPPPPPLQSENTSEISTDCKNGDKCEERCTIEKFLLYETVAHQTSLLRCLAQYFQREPDHAVQKVGAKTCAAVLAYL